MPNVLFAHLRRSILFSVMGVSLSSICLPLTSIAQQKSPQLAPDTVQVGYGNQNRKEVTGAIETVPSKQFNQGLILSTEQLFAGQVAGLQVSALNGAPGAGFLLQLQRNATLAGQEAPLLVIDGMQVEHDTGLASPLALLNPHDIASITFLKDAAATGIYGTKGVNGVLLISTKRGIEDKKLQVDFQTQVGVSKLPKKVDVLSSEQFRQVILQRGTTEMKNNLGAASTDWQETIYESAVSHDQNLSLAGKLAFLPYRASLGYLDQKGILTNTYFKRISGALALSPSFFEDHLKIDLSLKGMQGENRTPNQNFFNLAVYFDPTQPVYAPNGDYFEWRDTGGNQSGIAPLNPLGALRRSTTGSENERNLGNARISYRLHFLPAVTAHVNVGYDHTKTDGKDNAILYAFPASYDISYFRNGQKQKNKLTEYYFTFADTIPSLHSQVEVTTGYSAQDFEYEGFTNVVSLSDGQVRGNSGYTYTNTSKALFGRINYRLKDRYFLSATLRRDETPSFVEQNRAFTSKTVGVSWLLSEEDFLKDQEFLSELKVRTSFGQVGNTPLLPGYTFGSSGSGTMIMGNSGLTWEKTTSLNLGVEATFTGNRFRASLDLFQKKTDDLLSYGFVPYNNGGFSIVIVNGGELKTKGAELSLQYTALSTEKASWLLGLTASYATNELLSAPSGAAGPRTFPGQFVWFPRLVNLPGNPINSFYVYQQRYNNGTPQEGVYDDLTNDGSVGPNDLKTYHSPRPKSLLGFTSQATYRKWSLGLLARAQVGAYVYHREAAQYGFYNNIYNSTYPQNLSSNVLESNFVGSHFDSDYYVKNASFLRMEYLTLGYSFGKVWKDKVSLHLNATVQNAFVLTNYSGQDPEVPFGDDAARYPLARTFSLGLNLGL